MRLDEQSDAALKLFEDLGMSQSEAIRYALAEAARAKQTSAALRAEAERIAADEDDRREKAAITEFMDDLSDDPW